MANDPAEQLGDGRATVVLFADISDSTKLYETAGDAIAIEAVHRCIADMRRVTESVGGRVVKTIGDEVMACFPTPDLATVAAASMQQAISTLPSVGEIKLELRIGFHAGPVMQRGEDVFGDTVNVAARLVKQATRGQIVASEETVQGMAPMFRAWTRSLYAVAVKGRQAEVALCEVIWRQSSDITAITMQGVARPSKPLVLRLRYANVERRLRRNPDSISIGREAGQGGIAVTEPNASRRHCVIERRNDLFVLADHSANGTFVTVDGDAEVMLRREELALRRRGWISLGQPRAGGGTCIEFAVE